MTGEDVLSGWASDEDAGGPPVTGLRFAVGQVVLDHDREGRGEVVGVYPSPLVVWLAGAVSGVQWIARTLACEPLGVRPAVPAPGEDVPAVAGRVAVDVPPIELRVGDQVLEGGRLVAIADLRCRHGGTRTMILATGRVRAAGRTVRVWRRVTGG